MGTALILQRKGRFRFGLARPEEERTDPTVALNTWVDMITSFNYGGLTYTLPSQNTEEIAPSYPGLARAGFMGNSVVFACISVRMMLFSEARFQFRQMVNGRPGDLFGTQALSGLETPGPGMTTGDMLTKALLHADLGGNWFGTSRYGGVTTLQPNWVTIVAGNPNDDASLWDPETQVIGYSYQPGGPGSGEDPVVFLPEEVAHFAPIPDPLARFRGMSWLTPVIREVMSDRSMVEHKINFLDAGATPNMIVKFSIDDVERYMPWIEKFREQHEGAQGLKTLFLGAGMDATPVGTNLQQLDFKSVQGAGETRIAAAANVPPVLVGLSEGLAAATYSNYGMARRRFADMTMRPLWRNIAGSLARIVVVPGGSELWYDDRDIAALQEDMKDAAEIMQRKIAAIGSAIINGFEPDSAVAAVAANDETKLVHTGLVSVQLQEPGTKVPDSTAPGQNGKGVLPMLPAKGRDELISDAIRAMARENGHHEPRQLALELHLHDERSIEMPPINVEIPEQEPSVVNVTVEKPDPQEPPVVNVDVNVPEPRSSKKTVEFGDGRTATVTTEVEE